MTMCKTMTGEVLKAIIYKLVNDKSLNDHEVNVIDRIVERKDYKMP